MSSFLLTFKEAAELAMISESTVKRWAKSGRVPVHRNGIRAGNNRPLPMVPLEALPKDIQARYSPGEPTIPSPPSPEPSPIEEVNLAEIPAERLEEANERVRIVKLAIGKGKKDVKLLAAAHGVSWQTLYRWRKDYQEGGIRALIRRPRSDRGSRRIVEKAVEDVIAAKYLGPQRLAAAQVHQDVERLCAVSGRAIPSYSTTKRIIEAIPEPAVAMHRRGMKRYRDIYEPTQRREKLELPAMSYCGDHHKLDVWVNVQERKKPVRPWLTAWQDLCTGEIVGFHISLQGNSRTIALAARHAILEKKFPSYHEKAGQYDERFPACGIPDEFYVDNGKDYLSLDIEAVSDDLDINISKCERYHGQSKPIERWFGTLETGCIRRLPGWCGSSPSERPENIDVKLSIDELKQVIYEWIVTEYHVKAQKDLGDRSPVEVRAAKIAEGWRPRVPREEALDLLLTKKHKPLKVRREGVYFLNHLYWHKKLDDIIQEKVEVRYDPDELGRLHIFYKGLYHCTAENKKLEGFKSGDVKELMRRRKRTRQANRDYLESRQEVLAQVEPLEKLAAEQRREAVEEEVQGLMAAAGGGGPVTVMLPQYDRATLPGAGGRSSAAGGERPVRSVGPVAPEGGVELPAQGRRMFADELEREYFEEHGCFPDEDE